MTTTNASSGTVIPEEFRALCEKHGVPATRRQWSKYRGGYGLLRLKTGTSRRAAPTGPNSTRQGR